MTKMESIFMVQMEHKVCKNQWRIQDVKSGGGGEGSRLGRGGEIVWIKLGQIRIF